MLVLLLLVCRLQIILKINLISGPRREKTCLRGFPTKRVSNQSPQLQRLARKLKFHL